MTTPTLAELRKKAEKSAKQAADDQAELYKKAIAEAITSDAYGHLSAVAREAGIVAQYLRELVEKQHPGWLAQAAANREQRKEAGKRKGGQAEAA